MRRAGGGDGDAGRDAGGPVRGARRARRRASAGRRAEAEDCGRAAGGVRARRAGVWHKHTGSGPRAASVRRACHPCEPVRREFGHRVGRSRDAAARRCAPLTAQARRTRGRIPFPRRARPHGPPIQRVSTSSPSRPQPVGRSRRAVSGPIPALPAGVARLDGALRPRVSRAAARRAGAHTSTAAPSHAASRPLVCNCDRKFATSAARSWYVVASV